MVQRSNMWYAYFRFYIDEDDIRAGLDTYCKEWENMFAVGYNYREYKCFVDNLGGFEHWVGDMSGYISQDREVGFIDGSPSDNVYDSTLLMGKTKMNIPDLRYLHVFKPPTNIYMRKTSASSAGAGKIKTTFNSSGIFEHNFYLTLDSLLIEIFNYTQELVNSDSGVSAVNYAADVGKVLKTLPVDTGNTTFSNPNNSVDGNFDTYAAGSNAAPNLYFDLGSIQSIYNLCYKYYLTAGGSSATYLKVYYGDTIAGCTNLIDQDHIILDSSKTEEKYAYRDLDIAARYLRFNCNVTGDGNGSMKLYQVFAT